MAWRNRLDARWVIAHFGFRHHWLKTKCNSDRPDQGLTPEPTPTAIALILVNPAR